MVVPLDDLQEEGGAVLHGLGEDLQQVAVVVKVHQDLQTLELGGVRQCMEGRNGEREKKRDMCLGAWLIRIIIHHSCTGTSLISSLTVILAVESLSSRVS